MNSVRKELRIKKNHEIKNVIELRESVGDKFFVIYRKKRSDQSFRFAVSVSKKYGHAVERNYAKRCVREILKKEYLNLVGFDLVIVIKHASKFLSFSQKENQLNKLFIKIVQNKLKNNDYKRLLGGHITNEKPQI